MQALHTREQSTTLENMPTLEQNLKNEDGLPELSGFMKIMEENLYVILTVFCLIVL